MAFHTRITEARCHPADRPGQPAGGPDPVTARTQPDPGPDPNPNPDPDPNPRALAAGAEDIPDSRRHQLAAQPLQNEGSLK